MIKLIATDIDGTLVKDGSLLIDPEYMSVIDRLIDKGIIFVVCSGRQFSSEFKLFAPIKHKLLYITDGGTVVRTPKEILKTYPMDEDIWKGMCRMVRDELPACDYFACHKTLQKIHSEISDCYFGYVSRSFMYYFPTY